MWLVFVLTLFSFQLALSQPNPCTNGQTFQCADGTKPSSARPPCASGKPQCCDGSSCTEAPAPGGAAGGGAPPAGGGSSGCTNPQCANPPCAAPLVGDVGCTTVAGTEIYDHEITKKGDVIATGSHIFGPFEAGFGEEQRSIIEGWGCADPTVVYDSEGGLDLVIAEEKVSKACGIELPRMESSTVYKGLVGYCGGHTRDYHFHVRFACLYPESGGHSIQIGVVAGHKLYGKWEDYANNMLPYLDACSAHFGPTPDSNGQNVYHYHVQDKAPFAVGCHGPDTGNKLMSVARCRSLYTTSGARTGKCDSDASAYIDLALKRDGASVTVKYDKWCPCWDAAGSNLATNIQELPALSTSEIAYEASGGAVIGTTKAGAGSATTVSTSASPGNSPTSAPGTSNNAPTNTPTNAPTNAPGNSPTNAPTAAGGITSSAAASFAGTLMAALILSSHL